MNNVNLDGTTYYGPSSYHELTPAQWQQFLRSLASDEQPGRYRTLLDEQLGRYALLMLWYGIPLQELERLDAEQRLALLELLSFLDTRPSKWMQPQLRLRGRSYVGPGDELEFLVFGEFMDAEAALQRYSAEPDPAHLADLATALYRPKALPFHEQTHAGRRLFVRRRSPAQAKVMARLDAHELQGILLNYQGCRDTLPAAFKYLFKASETPSSEESTWLDVGLNLARSTSALGSFAQLEQTNLYLVLMTLNSLLKEQEQLKKP